MALKFWAHTSFYYENMEQPYNEMLAEMVDIAQAAEDLGFEGVTIPENQFQNYITCASALQFSAAVAMRTKRIKILPGVIVLPQYHPLTIASDIALIDNLAPGRISVGVARGGNRYPTDRTGINADHARGMYEESLEIIQRAWVEDDMTYDGTYYSFPETTLVPKPHTKPYPDIWVAAQSTEGVTNVAKQGYNLITSPNHGDFEPHGDLESLMETYNTAAAESGQKRGEVMVLRHTFLHEDEQQALAKLDKVILHWNHYMATIANAALTKEDRLSARVDKVAGVVKGGRITPATHEPSRENVYETYDDPILTNPQRAIERFKHYEEIGVDHVTCISAMGFPIDEVIQNMELMAKEVFPAFAETPAETTVS